MVFYRKNWISVSIHFSKFFFEDYILTKMKHLFGNFLYIVRSSLVKKVVVYNRFYLLFW